VYLFLPSNVRNPSRIAGHATATWGETLYPAIRSTGPEAAARGGGGDQAFVGAERRREGRSTRHRGSETSTNPPTTAMVFSIPMASPMTP